MGGQLTSSNLSYILIFFIQVGLAGILNFLFPVESFYTDGTAPGSLWCNLHRRHQAVHVVTSVAVVTEQKLVVVLAGPAQGAGLALDALPGVLLDTDQHVLSELETGGMARSLRTC
jgi:hypothetical protein